MTLTPDAQAMLLICSRLGLPARSELTPLTLGQWNAVSLKLQESSLGRPGALLGMSSAQILAALELSQQEADQVAKLLERGGALAIELDRLASLGIWVLTRADDQYPQRLKQRLKGKAPPVLFGAGESGLLGQPGLAVVGSRDVDEAGLNFAAYIGDACARCDRVVYSGAARGVDRTAMTAALAAGGQAVGVLSESLERLVRTPDNREVIARRDLTVLTDSSPNTGFNVGAAMGRNKIIYALADFALVVASAANEGGTWAGAVEALKHRWCPVFVLSRAGVPAGNELLIKAGAIAWCEPFLEASHVWDWLVEHAHQPVPAPAQGSLF